MKHVYLRYLALAQNANESNSYMQVVDETAKRLLEVIALSHAQNRPLTVTAAMALQSMASPGTVHRKLSLLRKNGLIEQVFQGGDQRTKYLVPTAASDDYFDKLGRILVGFW